MSRNPERFVPPKTNAYMYDTQDWNSWTISSGYDPVLVSGFSTYDYTIRDASEDFKKNYKYDYREINGIYKPMTKPGNIIGPDEIIYVKDDKKSYIQQTLINLSPRDRLINMPRTSGYPQDPVWAIYIRLPTIEEKYKIIAYFYPGHSRIINTPLINSWVLILSCNDDAKYRALRWATEGVPKVNVVAYDSNRILEEEKVIESKEWRLAHPIRTTVGFVPEQYRRRGGRKTKHSTKKNKRKTRKFKKNKITK